MRTKQEIKQAVAILNRQDDPLSRVQVEVLQGGMTEKQVFMKYVIDIPDADRDEAAFFAARDAARFTAGHIGLEELVPDLSSMTETADPDAVTETGNDTVTLPRREFEQLLARIERLEQWTGLRRKAATGSIVPGTLPANADMKDLMKQNEACRYLSCSKNTIKGYASRGLIHSYRQGRFTYYSRKEIDKNIKGAMNPKSNDSKEREDLNRQEAIGL